MIHELGSQRISDEHEELRKILLRYGWADNYVSLGRVDSLTGIYCRPRGRRWETRRELVMGTLESLLHDGLFTAGDLDTHFHFTPFQSPKAAVMDSIRRRYLQRDPLEVSEWGWSYWFQITDKGRQAHAAMF